MKDKKSLPVLVVDDERDIQDLLHIFLELNGYRVKVAENGEEAVKMALEETPLLMVTDVAMPVQDGTETVYMFTQMDSLKCVPTIVMTALGNVDEVKKISDWAGANYFIAKPLQLEELLRVIDVIAKKRLASFQ